MLRTKKHAGKAKRLWRITRIDSTPTRELGIVTAPDEKTAIERAITEFQVPPALRDRLIARRVG
jgi:hypothetical protein